MMKPVSLIIPVHNREAFLPACLDSVRHQTFADFEVILVNDGSTDGSEEICRRYVREDPRFRLISIPNRGAAGARNVALQAAAGECIAFTDSDDWLEPDYLQYLYEGLQHTGADVFFCDFCIDGRAEHHWPEGQFSGSQAVCQLVAGGCCNRINNKLYRKEVVAGVPFPEGRNLCEDAPWTAQVLEKASLVARGPAAKYHIRPTQHSLSRQKRHTESQVCAFYRNLLERCIVLMRQYDRQEAFREAILAECIRRLKLVLESGCNLELWEVYPTAKALCQANQAVFQEQAPFLAQCFLQSQTGRECSRRYLGHVMRSGSIPERAAVVQKQLLSILRRMRKAPRQPGEGTENGITSHGRRD